METVSLATQPRTGHGKRGARKLRTQGLVPAIIYGHKQTPVAVALGKKDIDTALRHHARIVDLKIDGQTETAVIQEVQHDHLGVEVLHVDFKRVSKDERIEVAVPIELKGTPTAVGHGGVLDQPLHELEVECLAIAIPENIRVNIGELQIGQAIHVKELTLPEGVKALNDPEAVVVQLRAFLAEPEPTAAAPAEGAEPAATEPEIVGRRVKEETPEEE
jgi:large subunit ribosomal protein L25